MWSTWSQLVARIALFCFAGALLASCGTSARKPIVGSMAQLHRDRVSAVIDLGGGPDWQTVAFGSVWVANDAIAAVQRINPRTNTSSNVHIVSQPCSGLTAGFGSVWSEDCSTSNLDRIDPDTMRVVATIPVIPAGSEGYIAAGNGAIWSAGLTREGNGALTRVNPKTNRVSTQIRMPGLPSGVAAGFNAIWVTIPDLGVVERVNPNTNRIAATIKVHAGPRFLAAGEGGVWVLNQSDGSVSRIDPSTNRVAATIAARVPGDGGCIAAGQGGVWVTMPGTPFIRIDPGDNRIWERYRGVGGDCISAGLGSVWLSNNRLGNVWRIKP
jgi:virginiamycin B lyase